MGATRKAKAMTNQNVPFYHADNVTLYVTMAVEVDTQGDYLLSPEQLKQLERLHAAAPGLYLTVRSRLRRTKKMFMTVKNYPTPTEPVQESPLFGESLWFNSPRVGILAAG